VVHNGDMGVASKEWVSGMLFEKIDGVLQGKRGERGENTCSPGYTESASRGQHTLMTLDTPRWRGGKKKRSRLVHYEQLFLSQLLEEKEFRD